MPGALRHPAPGTPWPSCPHSTSKVGVLVVAGRDDVNTWKSFANLPEVHVVSPGELNAYDVLVSDTVVFSRDTLPACPPAAADAEAVAEPDAEAVAEPDAEAVAEPDADADADAEPDESPTGDEEEQAS